MAGTHTHDAWCMGPSAGGRRWPCLSKTDTLMTTTAPAALARRTAHLMACRSSVITAQRIAAFSAVDRAECRMFEAASAGSLHRRTM